MTLLPFSLELKNRLPEADWPWLLAALRQDHRVWAALETTGLGRRSLEALPPEPAEWSPAALGLLAIQSTARARELASDPVAFIEEALRGQVEQAYQAWLTGVQEMAKPGSKPATPDQVLARCASIALEVREQLIQDVPWRDVFSTLHLDWPEARLILACLYGFIPEPESLLSALLRYGQTGTDLAVHTVLCQPLAPQVQAALLKALLDDLDQAHSLDLLNKLGAQRPALALDLAGDLLQAGEAASSKEMLEDHTRALSDQFDQLAGAVRLAECYRVVGQSDRAVPLLAETLRLARRLRGHLSARLAEVVANADGTSDEAWRDTAQETSLEAWKQAVQLVPDEPRFVAGLVHTLLDHGRWPDAQAYLAGHQTDGEYNPSIALASALLCEHSDEPEAARRQALQALRLVESGEPLTRKEFLALSRLLERLDLSTEAARAVQVALAGHPMDAEMLALQARLQLSLGQAALALSSAYAAQAAGVAADDHSLEPLVVTALETVGAWANALDYRLAQLRATEKPTLDDYHAVIRCADYAGQNDLLAEFSSQALLLDPEDVPAHRGLAQAALSAGDYTAAIDYLVAATDLAPEQPGLWLLLVEAYRRAGQDAKAEETLRTANQAVPGDAGIQAALGEVYLAQGAPTQALSYFRSAAELAPTQHHALRLGQTLLLLGHVSQACQVLGEAYQAAAMPELGEQVASQAALQPDTELTFSYARALLAARQIEPAIPLMLAVVRARPEDPEAQLELARVLLHSADQPANVRRAIALLQRILGLNLDGADGGYAGKLDAMPALRAEARALLAEAYSANGEWDLAMQAYQRALDDPLNRSAERQTRLSAGLGLVALRLEQPEMAVASLEEAAQAEPGNIRVLCALSEAYLASGLDPDAYETALTVRSLAPDDLEATLWFIEQGARLADQTGLNAGKIHAEILQAMKAATLLAPERADLLLRLGRMLVEENDASGALQAFQRMAEADAVSHRLTPAQLSQVAQVSRGLGDAALAVLLLERAVALARQGGAENPPAILADLLAELSLAQQQAGSPELALQAVDQALSVDEDRAMLHAQKAELLQQAGQVDDALDSLRSAVRLSPRNPDLRLRMANLLSQRDDLPGALEQAEKGLAALAEAPAEEENHDLARSLNREAATLAFITLRPHRAREYLSAITEAEDDAEQDFSEAALRAELSLETGDLEQAGQAIVALKRLAPEHPRTYAAAARLAHRLRDEDERDRTCRGAIRRLVQLQLNQEPISPPATKVEFIASYLSTAQAALDNCQWEAALETLDRLIEALPETPAAHYLRAQALARRGEAQLLFQDLDVTSRALGAEALSEGVRQAFDQDLAEAQRLLATGVELGTAEELKPWQDECCQRLALCMARGKALFQPSLQSALVMQSLLQAVTPTAGEVAALVMAFRRCGEHQGAFQAAQVGWRPVFEGDDVCTHPLVLTQVALAEQQAQQALAEAQDALAFAEKQGDGWPAQPMLHYLLARTAQRAEAYPLAMDAIQKALAAWPDEPRWQSLAAQIFLAQDASAGLPDRVQALVHLEQAASLDPNCAANHLALGQLYLEDGQALRAVQSIQQASELDETQPKVWIALAQAQFAADELEQAAISAERAIENNPEPEGALLLRGRIALQTNNPRGALSRAQTILRDAPDHPEAIYLLSQALEAMDRPAEALVALDRALALSANPFPLQIERVQLLRRSKGLEAGVASLQELVAHNPQQPVLMAMLAEWLNEAGRPEAAIQAARLALQEEQGQLSEEQRASLHIIIGLRMCRLGQLDQAIHHLSEAVDSAPANLEAYLELGRAYQERREYRQALKVYQRAMSVAKNDYRPYYQAGLVLKDSKDYVAAEAMLRRAAQLAPAEVSVHRLLGAVVALNLVHNRRLTPAGH